MASRPFTITLLAGGLAWFGFCCLVAGLLAFFADPGAGLPMPIGLSLAFLVFGLAASFAARAAWRMDPTTPRMLQLVGIAGILVAIAMAVTLSPPLEASKVWPAALGGGILFASFAVWQARRFERKVASAA
jgi:zinc transporter ZupT